MKSHATPPVFVGRQEQLASLQEALAAVPAVVVVEGEPGIGKTTLVDRFVEPLAHMRVVRASGVESERDLSFGVADQILRRCAADPVVGVTADPVIVGARLLDALADAAPVVLVVDDAQWADAASLRALLFAWRRLVADRVLVVLATRDGCLPEGLVKAVDRRLRLPPLDAVELARLAAGLGVELPVPDAERLHAHTGGVPLHARAVLEELPAGRRALPEGELPAPRTFALVVARRLQACSEPARALAEAVAVLGPCSLAQAAELATATAEDGAPVAAFEALDEASAAGLLTPGTGRDVGPAHPLVGAAVLGAMPMARRARMHRAAADIVTDEAAALRHRAAATVGADARLATDFEAFAGKAGTPRPAAATALITASRLSVTVAERDERLLRAFEWLTLAGDFRRAHAYAADIAAMAPSARRESALAALALHLADTDEAAPRLADAWQRCDPGSDSQLAALIAHQTAFCALMSLRDTEVVTWASRGADLAPEAPFSADRTAMRTLALWRLGRKAEAYAALEGADERYPQLRGMRGWLRCADDDLARGRHDLEAAIEAELRLGAASIAAVHLTTLARAHFAAGLWDDAVVAAERARALAAELDHAPGRAFVWWAAIMVPLARGDAAAASEYIRRAVAEPGDAPDRLVAVGMARALHASAGGDSSNVIAALAPVARLSRAHEGLHGGVDAPGFWPWQDIYADALVSEGRLADAETFLTAHEALATQTGHASMTARLACVRGRLEAARRRGDHARAAFDLAREAIAPVGMPYELALVELAYGQFLRRSGQRRTAGTHLAAARDQFAALGAQPALARADRELEACGLKSTGSAVAGQDSLTPQEQAVARLVSLGRTNREVAQELMLSVKTVEVHLTRTYAKLGVTSRGQLAALRPRAS